MKRFLGLVGAVLVASFLMTACGSTRVPVFIRIGTDASLAPFESVDDSNNITGFDVDLIKSIASNAGLNVQMVNLKYDRLLTGVARCEFEGGISMITINNALKSQVNFSDPYLTYGQVVVVKKGNITISGQDQLAGMVVGTQKDSLYASNTTALPGAQVKVYDSFDLAFQDLVNGYIDAVVAGYPRALSYVNIKANNLKIVGSEFGSESLGIAVCNQRADLLKAINDGLAKAKADGTIDKLKLKWLKVQ